MNGGSTGGAEARQGGDLFDSAVTFEEDHISQGYAEGVRDGHAVGVSEGRELGLQKGFEVAQEVGFYSGCLQVWRQLAGNRGQSFSDRAVKQMSLMEALIDDFPLSNTKNDRLHDSMDSLQGKFKLVTKLIDVEYYHKEEQRSMDY